MYVCVHVRYMIREYTPSIVIYNSVFYSNTKYS